jgi:hypothetical protein
MNTQIFVAISSDISIEEMLPDIIAAFRVVGESDYVVALSISDMDCVIEFLELCLSSECVAEVEEALAVYVM